MFCSKILGKLEIKWSFSKNYEQSRVTFPITVTKKLSLKLLKLMFFLPNFIIIPYSGSYQYIYNEAFLEKVVNNPTCTSWVSLKRGTQRFLEFQSVC